MKIYGQEEICRAFTKYVRISFDSAGIAADHYGCTGQFISNIKNNRAAPNEQMLKDIGVKRKNGFVRDKR